MPRGKARLHAVEVALSKLRIDALGTGPEGVQHLDVPLLLPALELAHVKVQRAERGIGLHRLGRDHEALRALRNHLEREEDRPHEGRAELPAVVCLIPGVVIGRTHRHGDARGAQHVLDPPDLVVRDGKSIRQPPVGGHVVGPHHGLVHAVVGPPALRIACLGHVARLDHVQVAVGIVLPLLAGAVVGATVLQKGATVAALEVGDVLLPRAFELGGGILVHKAAAGAHAVTVGVNLRLGQWVLALGVGTLVLLDAEPVDAVLLLVLGLAGLVGHLLLKCELRRRPTPAGLGHVVLLRPLRLLLGALPSDCRLLGLLVRFKKLNDSGRAHRPHRARVLHGGRGGALRTF